MPDIVDVATRSKMMSGIRSKDTRPEMLVRKSLHQLGYRYRLHDKRLPGKPDLVFPKYHAVIHVHGCFWHGHGCHLFKWPATRTDFWQRKIAYNQQRDREVSEKLALIGWRQLTVWECALKGRGGRSPEEVITRIEEWLKSRQIKAEILGDDIL